jgi:soluble lytic murein transglycosylase
LRASVYQFNRDFAGARLHYLAIVNGNPQSGTLPSVLYQLGRGFYLEGKYEEARNYFQKTFDLFPQSTSARDALSYLAASYSRVKRVDDAISSYKLFIDRFPDAPNPERPYLNIIDALHEAGRYPEAMTWVQQTRARFKSKIGSALALFAQMRIHLAQSSWKEAGADADELLKLSDLGGTGVPGGTTQAEVTFLRAYALEQSGTTDEAIAGYVSIPDGRNEYYGMRATDRLQSLGRNEKTRSLVRSRLASLLADAKAAGANGRTDQARVYAQRALRFADDPSSRAAVVQILQTTYDTLPAYKLPTFNLLRLGKQILIPGDAPIVRQPHSHQAIADDLLFLGLYDEAMPELFAARAASSAASQTEKPDKTAKSQDSNSGSSDDAYTVAIYSLRGGLPNRAVRFGEQFWKSVPSDYALELAPRALVELLYPVPYTESLLKHAPATNVDPRFVLSIARQESRYRADAKSVAAARGMMQFISSTASEIAAQLKPGPFNQDDLYDPDTAIRFGSRYLGNLFQQFPNEPEAVAAAYNSGADNVARWVARSRATEPERYVPEIGFAQTKDYVFRVMSNFWNYKRLYDAQLKPQPAK